jgi:hypothetical protein
MFSRWIKLLVVLLIIVAGGTYYYTSSAQNSWSGSDTCMSYLKGLDNTWTSSGDSYFKNICDLENPVSDASLEMKRRDQYYSISQSGFVASFALIVLMVLSVVARWLFTGKVR